MDNGARMQKKVGSHLFFIFLFFLIPNAFPSAYFLEANVPVSVPKSAFHFSSQSHALLVDLEVDEEGGFDSGKVDKDEEDSFDDSKIDPDEDGSFDDSKIDPDDMDEEPDEGGGGADVEPAEEESAPESPADEDGKAFGEDSAPENPSDEGEGGAEDEKEDPDEEIADEAASDEEPSEEMPAEDGDGNAEAAEEEVGKSDLSPENSVAVCFGLSSIPESYFGTTFSLDGSYRNYFRYPVYWLCGGGIGKGSPNGDYPYTYQIDGDNLAPPSFYSTYAYGGAGLVYNNVEKGFAVFSEFVLGLNFRILYNGSIKHAHSGKLYPNLFGDFSVGGSWRWLRASLGVQYDTNWKFVFGGKIGVAIPIEMFKKLKK